MVRYKSGKWIMKRQPMSKKKDTVNPPEKIKGVTTHSNSSCGWLASTTGFHYPK